MKTHPSRISDFRASVRNRRRTLTGEVDDEEIDDELGDLEGGEVLFPPDLVPSRRHEVVVVPAQVNGRSAFPAPVSVASPSART